METYRDILEHHGIKGMKWGIRKSIRSEQKHRMPFGTKVDGFQPSKKPFGAKVDGAQSKDANETSSNKKVAKKVAIGAAAAASIIGAGYLATTMTARHKILKEGKKRSEALLKTSAGIVVGGATPQQRHAMMSLKDSYMNEAGKAIDDSKKKAKEVGRSFGKSARYLYENRKKR